MAEQKLQELENKIDWRAFTPDDSPKTPPELFADPAVRDLATAKLRVGDAAADIELPLLDFSDGALRETDEIFRLRSAAAERPVALVFGSYT